MPGEQVDYDDELSEALYDAVKGGDVEKVQELVDDPRVNINWVCPQTQATCLAEAAWYDSPEAIFRSLLGSNRINVNTIAVAPRSMGPLHLVAVRGPISRLRDWLSDDRFDVHVRADNYGSILDCAIVSDDPQMVRIVLEDGRVQPDAGTLSNLRNFQADPCCYKLILQHIGRRLRDDFQNARQACKKMGIPQEVVDTALLPFLGQDIFPAGMKLEEQTHFTKFLNIREMKTFIGLFGNLCDFAWPDVSSEKEKKADRFGWLVPTVLGP